MKVLMIGPGRGLKGGIASVVESYYEVGLDKVINLEYLETFCEGSNIEKINFALKSLKGFKKKAKSADIIHIHMSSRGSFYRKSLFVIKASMMKKKIILHIHGSEFKKFYDIECNSFIKKYVRNILNKANKVIALSDEWKDLLGEIVDKEKIEILYNSIQVGKVNENKDYKRNKILFLGRVGERKGVYDIIKLVPKIIERYSDAEFIIAGDGEVEQIRKLVEEKQLDNNVKILGWTSGEDKINLIREATIYLLPSYNEGMPISILEAMANQLPIVSTIIGGIPQLVKDGEEGYLFEAGDLNGFEKAIEKVLSSEKERARLGRNSFDKVDKCFNLEKNINKLIDLYNNC